MTEKPSSSSPTRCMRWRVFPTVWQCCVMAALRAILTTKDTNAEDMTNRMVGHKVTLNIERPEPVNPKPRLEVKGLTVKTEDGIVKLKGCLLYRQKRRDPWYCRNFRLRSEGASGSNCGTSVHQCGKHYLYRRKWHERRTHRQRPPGDHGYGRVPFLCSGGPSGHGSGGRYGPYRQYDAPFLPERPLRIYRP